MNKYEEALHALMDAFNREKDILVVYLYGSVARGDFSERHSDMDLFIVMNRKTVPEAMKERLSNMFMPLGMNFGVRLHLEFQGTEIQKEDQTLVAKMIEEGRIIFATGIFTYSYRQLGLRQYLVYSYSLKNSKQKTLFSKALHGRKSWYYKGKEKIVKYYEGIANKDDLIMLGKGYLLVAREKNKDIEQLFKRFEVDYTQERIMYG